MLETLGLDARAANEKLITANIEPLAKHEHGEPTSGNFNCNSVVGMLFYLTGHTCPGITYDVNCAARYMFCPNLVLTHALKQVGCYLKSTSDQGLITKPSEKLLKIDSFPYAGF